MNVIQVRHINDYSGRLYTFQLPDGVAVTEGTLLKVKPKRKCEDLAIAVTNSVEVEDETILKMVAGGNKVCSKVVGIYNLVNFDWFNLNKKEERENYDKYRQHLEGCTKDEVINLCVQMKYERDLFMNAYEKQWGGIEWHMK